MNWKAMLGSVAPTIATALGGPFAGMAAKAAIGALGMDAEGKDTQELERILEHQLESNPDALLKLKESERLFKTQLKTLGIDLEKVHSADRADARSMAANTTLLPQMVLATVYVLVFAVILVVVFTGTVQLDGAAANMANILLGILSAGLLQVMNFFFGSSSGSKEKTAKLKLGGAA